MGEKQDKHLKLIFHKDKVILEFTSISVIEHLLLLFNLEQDIH